jgi:hypothetical protein
MVYWHIFIGIGEAVISALIVFYIYKVKPEFITTESILMKKVVVLKIERFKRPVTSVVIIIGVLMLMIAVGFTIGILSEAPDGLERVLIDYDENLLNNLEHSWIPLLGWVKSDYSIGILGIIISVIIMSSIFFIIVRYKRKNQEKKV